mmetsp:Transcript_27811/g.59466  ORF Transcript_27811/g.59466 Transcript_27811/m.59466 type:complete len:346 (+) Transcript_27811:122-1159(+)
MNMESYSLSTDNHLSKPSSSIREWLNIPSSDALSSKMCQTTSLVQCLDPQAHANEYWKQKTRPDGRLFSQTRGTQVVYGMLKHSAGSALVSQNRGAADQKGTKILAATTFNIGQPSPEHPDEGEVVVQVSGTGGRNIGACVQSQQEQHYWDVLQSWLQKTVEQDARMVQSLNLFTGKACLRLVVTVIVLEDIGNVKDVALLAIMAAWRDTRLPKVGRDLMEVQGKLWWKQGTKPLTSLSLVDETGIPEVKSTEKKNVCDNDERYYHISLTMGIWVHPTIKTTHFLADPSSSEEPFLEGTVTITVSLATGKLLVDYSGTVPFTANDMAMAAKLARARAKEVTTMLS